MRWISSALASAAVIPASCSSLRRSSPSSLSPRGLALALLEQVIFAIELSFAVDDAALFLLDLFASAADFDFPFFAKSYQLFFSAKDRRFAEALGLAIGFTNNALRCLFSGCVGLLLPAELGAFADPSADIQKNRAGNYEQNYAGCGEPRRVRHIYLCWARGKATGGPYRAGKSSRS
jgi:hypothetical protein